MIESRKNDNAMKNKVKLEDIIRHSPDAVALAQAILFAGIEFKNPESDGYCRYIRVVGLSLDGVFPDYESKWRLIAKDAAAFHESELEKKIKARLKERPNPGYFLEQVQVNITGQDGEDVCLQSDTP